ncbi:MAG: hypothetical protein M3Z27_06000 [Actinomycetota bacterium]|nr:hypothetical protein [Actinomycetota bacterium]
MPLISTKLHGAGDYATGVLLIAAPRFLPIRDRRAQAMAVATGGSVLLASAMTDYELGIRRKLPMPAHLLLDALTGGLLVAGAVGLRERRGTHVADWLPHALVGLGEVAGAALTERTPSDRHGSSGGSLADSQPPPPQAPTGASGQGLAAQAPAATGAPLAPAPVETPGPSVTPPAQPESDIERAERIDAGMADAGAPQTGETLVAQQEAAAAAEAAAIGGVVPGETDDPAMDPVFQAGGGEQDGWEAAEADLIENATHGDGHGQPERDAFSPEVESDRSTAVYGEGDRIPSTETLEDPATRPEDPSTGRS